MSMSPSEETAGRGYNPTLPSGPRKKKPKKKAPKKKAPKKPAPKVTNSTGGDQPVRVGRAAKQQPKKKLQYIISEARGMYAPKPKKVRKASSSGGRALISVEEAKNRKVAARRPKVYPKVTKR